MKKATRIICAVFAAAIVLCHFCVFAGVENGEAVIVLDKVSGMPGQSVEVNMTLTKNPGITGLRFFVAYDKEALTLEDVEYTKIGGGGLTAVNMKKNPFIVVWNVSTYEFTETGVLCKMTFKINSGAKVGELPIKVTYGKGDCIDFDLNNLSMDITDGSVSVLYDGTNCDHESTERITVESSTCKKAGKYEIKCKDCKAKVGEGALPVAEHSYGALIVTKVPSYDEFGIKEQECSVCGDVRTEQIPKLDREEGETVIPDSSFAGDGTGGSSSAIDSESDPDVFDPTPTDTGVATGDDTVALTVLTVLGAVSVLLLIAKKIKRRRMLRK